MKIYDFNLVGGRIEDIIDWCTFEYESDAPEDVKRCLQACKIELLRAYQCLSRARDLTYKNRS